MDNFRQLEKDMPEAGGIMMGRFIKNSKNIIIDLVTEPMTHDKRTRYTFKRIDPGHQIILQEKWERSGGTCNYLGEWHTHPENDPTPSGTDMRNWKRKLKNDLFSSRFLYFLIEGIKVIRVWEGDRRTLEIKELQITNYGKAKEANN